MVDIKNDPQINPKEMKITIPEMKHTIVRLTEDLTLRKKRLTELKA